MIKKIVIKGAKEHNLRNISLDIPKDKNVMLFFGMIKRIKGLEIILSSLSIIKEKNFDTI